MGITVKHRGAADGLTGAERDITGRSYDVTVIGGGILGAMAAWRLSRYDLRILLIDRAYDLGEGAAKANSGILYPGFPAERRQSEGDFLASGAERCTMRSAAIWRYR